MLARIQNTYGQLEETHPTHMKVGRFLISGSTATGANLGVLYILTDWFGVWYLASAVISYLLSFVVSFTLQKFWTFRDVSKAGMHLQAGAYVIVGTGNLLLNTGLMYALVEYGQVHYLIAQFAVSILIAIESYVLYQQVIFKRSSL